MRVFLAGATGVLGRRLVPGFPARGPRGVGLARSPSNEAAIRELGGQPRTADLFDPDSLAEAAHGVDVVVRAATAIPRSLRVRRADWAMNDRVRRDGTRALTEAVARVGARMYLQEGIVWVAQPADGTPFGESSPVTGRDWYAAAADAERVAREAAEAHGFQAATLRFGAFYAADSGRTRMMGEQLMKRKLPILGSGDAVWSSIHADDAAAAMVVAAEAGRSGVWHVVDNRTATMAEFFVTLARLLGAPPPRQVPLWLARIVAGRDTVSFLNASTRTSNARFRQDFGWAPRFPTIGEGLREVVDAWREEGFPG